MPLDAAFIQELASKIVKPEIYTVNRREHLLSPAGWGRQEIRLPEPQALTVATLSSVVDYIRENVDELQRAQCILHVVDPVTVVLRGKLDGEDKDYRRPAFLIAKASVPAIRLNDFLDGEVFYIQLQTLFEDAWDRAGLSVFVASMRESAVRDVIDSGVSQEVKTAAGVTLSDNTRVPNPVLLAPFRTFRELEQPSSQFVLRVKSKGDADRPLAALFEADGGLWKLTAIQSIKAYFQSQFTPGAPDSVSVPIIA